MKPAKQIRKFIQDELLEGLPMDGDPLAQGLLDSLAMEHLLGFIEERFGVSFDDSEVVAENFSGVDAVARLVQAKQRAKAAS